MYDYSDMANSDKATIRLKSSI